MERLLRHSAVYAAGNILQRVAGFLLIPLYTRVLSVGTYGALEVLSTLTSSALVLASLGLPAAFNKCYYRDCQDEAERRKLTGTAILLLLAAAVLTAAAGILLGSPLARWLLGDSRQSGLATLAMISASCFVLGQLPLMILRAREDSTVYTALSLGQFVAMMGLNLYLVGHLGLGIRGVLLGSIGSSVLVFAASVRFLLKSSSLGFSPHMAHALLAFGVPMVPVAVSSWVMNVSDRWLLQFLAGAEEVGLYGLGYRFGMLVEFLIVLPFQMAWPAFYFKEASRPDARQIYSRVLRWYVVAGGTISLALCLGGEIILRLMAEKAYWPGASVIPLIGLSYFLNGAVYCVVPGVHLGQKTHLMPVLTLIAAGANLGLNFLWIPRLGRTGAALATLVSFAILLGLTAWISRRVYGFEFGLRGLTGPLLLLSVLGVAGAAIRPGGFLALAGVRGAVILIAAIWAGRWCLADLGFRWQWEREKGHGLPRLVRIE